MKMQNLTEAALRARAGAGARLGVLSASILDNSIY